MPNESVGREVLGTVGGYFAGQLKISVILGLLYTVGFAIAGVPLWWLLGPISGLANLIPFVGGVLVLAVGAVFILFANGGLYNYLGLLAVFVAVQALEGFYLTPKLLGRRVGLRPMTVFLAILVGGMAFGPLGVILAVPAAAVLAIFWRRGFSSRA